jgi:peptide/nickel transport system substrate-binding protein
VKPDIRWQLPNQIDQELVDLIFDGLTRYNEDGDLVPALAEGWEVSEDRQTITFQLRDDVFWHDGQPVTSEDVTFTYGLLQDDSFPPSTKSSALWQGVIIRTVDSNQVVFELPEPYGPFLEATTMAIVPAHILQDVDIVDLTENRFNQVPVGTGPFMVQLGNDWQRTGTLRLIPNPNYWREGTMLDGIDIRFYADYEEVAEAFRREEIQAISNLEGDMAEIGALPDIEIYTSPDSTFTQLIFNLSETGSPAVQDAEVRQALAKGLGRDLLVDLAVSGQGLPLEGPYLPSSWAYSPGSTTENGYDPAAASVSLDTTGWILNSANQIRYKEDRALELRLVFPEDPVSRAIAREIARQWGEIGVDAILLAKNAEDLRQSLSEREFDAAILNIEPPGDPDLYDFWSQEAIVRGQNFSGWNNRWASEALESARQLFNRDERKPFYDAFLRFYNEELPAITLFQNVTSYAISEAIEEVDIGQINSPRERFDSMAQWFFFYREVSVACAGDET